MMDVSPADSVETSPDTISKPAQIRKSKSAYSRSLVWIATLTLALMSGYLLLNPTIQSSTPVQNSRVETLLADQVPKKVTPQQEQNSPPTNEPSPSPPSQLKQGENQGIVLRLKAVSDGKIHITIDGSVSQEYDLVNGDLVEWKAENTFILDLENAASVEGELDGVKMPPFGEAGRASHLVLKNGGIHKE
jgi:hypothetical protein